MMTSGSCLCGAVSYTGRGEPSAVHVCHCADCARWIGGPFMGVEFADGADIAGPVKWFVSSDWGERGHCDTCGSALFWRMRDGSHFTVTLGSVDNRDAIAPVDSHIFIDRKPPHYDFTGDAPRLTAAETIAKFTGQAE